VSGDSDDGLSLSLSLSRECYWCVTVRCDGQAIERRMAQAQSESSAIGKAVARLHEERACLRWSTAE
jgi:hypothetical protein